jgi:hypothetical protein
MNNKWYGLVFNVGDTIEYGNTYEQTFKVVIVRIWEEYIFVEYKGYEGKGEKLFHFEHAVWFTLIRKEK